MIKAHSIVLIALGFVIVSIESLTTAAKQDALEVMRAMLDENVMSTDIHQFSQENVNIVAFWLRSVNEADPTMCTVDYLRRLAKQLRIVQEYCEIFNMDKLHNIVLYRIIESCGDQLDDTEDNLGPTNEDLAIVGFIHNVWIYGPYNPLGTFRYLAEWMLKLIGYDKRGNRDEFMQAWENGPCKIVLDSLEQPDMTPVKNFVRLAEESEIDILSIESFELRFDIAVIRVCQYFQWKGALKRAWEALQDRDSELEQHVQIGTW